MNDLILNITELYGKYNNNALTLGELHDKAKALIDGEVNEARIDELKLITKNTIEKPKTPENLENPTWQGGYNMARNSLKRYKLSRIAQLKSQQTKEEA